MQWEFSPDEVVRGEVDYGLAAFREGLSTELRMNLAAQDDSEFRATYDLVYDLCHWLATGREFADFVVTLPAEAPLEAHVLQAVKEHMRDNVEMLGAILQRMIMDGVEQGMPLQQAVDATARRHAEVVAASV